MNWPAKLYVWATHRLYQELAWAYDPVSWLVSLGQWAGWRRAALDYVVGERILEVGFGTGELLLEMARRGLHGCGLERSTAMHRLTARKMARRNLWLPRVRGLTQRMPFPGGSFDTVVATFPAEYILDPATLRQVARLLRPPDPESGAEGGRLVVVGLVLQMDHPLLRRAMGLVFDAATDKPLDLFKKAAAAAGLHTTVTMLKGRAMSAPIIVAEKK
jgi:ubiquinone/menaquinone biosynthesis C-methylase UbiE